LSLSHWMKRVWIHKSRRRPWIPTRFFQEKT
jgi:hypothetical protein